MTFLNSRPFARVLAGLALLAASLTPTLAQAAQIEGVWRTPSGSEVTIEPCGSGFCGRVTKAVIPDHIASQYTQADIDAFVSRMTDELNKDPSLRGRPIMNLQILSLDGGNSSGRYSGKVYNPEDGNTYDGHVKMVSGDTLELSGCVLLVLCQSQNWARVD